MHVAGLELHNWLRFRGVHTLALRPGVYGLTARWEGSERRSNWAGKTSLLEAILFALFGVHRKRTEDEWITRGEPDGGVKLLLEGDGDSLYAERSRVRGKSTKLKLTIVSPPDEAVYELAGDEAQLEIERRLGLSLEDFEATCYVAQKRAARILTEDPGERMKIVSGWFRLAPLDEAADSVGRMLADAIEDEGRLAEAREVAVKAADDVLAELDPGLEGVGELELKADAECGRLQGVIALFERQLEAQATWRADFERAREYHRVVAEGKELRAQIEEYFPRVPSDEHVESQRALLDRLTRELGAAGSDVAAKRRLSLGDWDSACPLVGKPCPEGPWVLMVGAANSAHLAAATTAYNALAAERQKLAQAVRAEEELGQRLKDDSARRRQLLARAAELRPAVDATAGEPELDPARLEETRRDLATARQALQDAMASRARLRAGRDLVARQTAAYARHGAELEATRARASLLAEAAEVLRRARLEVAGANVAAIEAMANRALSGAGIDLQVRCSWARESKDPARHCACGAAFPSSARVKACARCGAARGRHLVEKFEIATSDESGAAEDLGGLAVQLAAAAWLRADRHAGCAFAMLDEVGAALDAEHRAVLAGALPRLLRELGFEQAFVAAHDPSMMAGMPFAIEILAGPTGSRILGERGDEGDAENGGTRDSGGARRDAPQGDHGSGQDERAGEGHQRAVRAPRAPHRRAADDGREDLRDGAGAGGRPAGKAAATPKRAGRAPRRRGR